MLTYDRLAFWKLQVCNVNYGTHRWCLHHNLLPNVSLLRMLPNCCLLVAIRFMLALSCASVVVSKKSGLANLSWLQGDEYSYDAQTLSSIFFNRESFIIWILEGLGYCNTTSIFKL